MFFNKLRYPLVLAVLFVAGLAFVAAPATAQTITPILSVTDEDNDTTNGIQVYGIRSEDVPFELTVTFQDDGTPPVNTPVTGFNNDDIVLFAADSSNRVVPLGATASPIRPNADGSVYTTTITAKGNISQVFIRVPGEAATTLGTFVGGRPQGGTLTVNTDQELPVEIIRSAADPLTLSPDKLIGGNVPFTVTLTSTTAITLTEGDINVGGGSIDGLSSDAARRVWTVTIRPGVGVTQVTVEPSTAGAYVFDRPKGTFTVDTTGPVATITGKPPIGGGSFPIEIIFNEDLQTGATLLESEITVKNGSIDKLRHLPIQTLISRTSSPIPVLRR